jgi:hypothetical protein
MARQHFREVCGVSRGDPWPEPDSIRLQEGTNMRYYTPNFWCGVQEKVNVDIFKKVANETMDKLVSERNVSNMNHSAGYSAKLRLPTLFLRR